MVSCNNQEAKQGEKKSDTNKEQLVEIEEANAKNELVEPVGFYEFAHQFSLDTLFQKEHVKLPLPNSPLTHVGIIKRKLEKWNYRKLWFGVEISTHFYTDTIEDKNREFFNKVSDSISRVSVFHLNDAKWNDLREDNSNPNLYNWNYVFKKQNGKWMLNDIEMTMFKSEHQESFFEFITAISFDDSLYRSRIDSNAFLVELSADLESHDTSMIDLDNYYYHTDVFNEIYFGEIHPHLISEKIMLHTLGEETGTNLKLYFERRNGLWYLMKEVNQGV